MLALLAGAALHRRAALQGRPDQGVVTTAMLE
jgi:hypothetical protein